MQSTNIVAIKKIKMPTTPWSKTDIHTLGLLTSTLVHMPHLVTYYYQKQSLTYIGTGPNTVVYASRTTVNNHYMNDQ